MFDLAAWHLGMPRVSGPQRARVHHDAIHAAFGKDLLDVSREEALELRLRVAEPSLVDDLAWELRAEAKACGVASRQRAMPSKISAPTSAVRVSLIRFPSLC